MNYGLVEKEHEKERNTDSCVNLTPKSGVVQTFLSLVSAALFRQTGDIGSISSPPAVFVHCELCR